VARVGGKERRKRLARQIEPAATGKGEAEARMEIREKREFPPNDEIGFATSYNTRARYGHAEMKSRELYPPRVFP